MRRTILSWRGLFVLAAVAITSLGARSDATALADDAMQGIYGAGCYNITYTLACWPDNCAGAPDLWIKVLNYNHETVVDNLAQGKDFWGDATNDRLECAVYFYDVFPCGTPIRAEYDYDADFYLYGDTCFQ